MKKHINVIGISVLLALSGCGGSDSDDGDGSGTQNISPTADAGTDITTYGKKDVTLTGTSSDSDGTVASVEWSQSSTDSLQVTLSGSSSNQPSFTIPDIYESTSLNFTLTVTDDDGAQSTDSITVNVDPAEHALALAISGLGDSLKVTSEETESISGSFSSDYTLQSLTISNTTTNQQFEATVSDIWEADITLAEGDNQLEITAISADGTEVSLLTEITYYPEVDFTTALQFDTDILYVGADATTVTGMIGSSNSNSPSIKLLDSDGSEVAELVDDGTLPDEIQGDGIYTASFSAQATEAGDICYRVSLTDSTTAEYLSEQQCIWGAEAYTTEEVSTAVDIADAVKSVVDQSISDNDSVQEAAEAALTSIQSNDDVAASGTTPDGGVWWINTDGILGLHHPVVDGSKSGAGRGGVVGATPVIEASLNPNYYSSNRLNHTSAYYLSELSDTPQFKTMSGTETENRITSSRAVLISPFINNPNVSAANNFGSTDDYYSVWQTIKDSNSCQLSADQEYLNNGSVGVTLDSFKDFSSYGYVHFSTHGDNYYQGLLTLWQDEWGSNSFLKGSLSLVALYTGLVLPTDEDGDYDITGYESDLQMKRLAIGPGGLLVVLPSFFEHYLSSLPNSLVALSACRSMYNNSMANVFLSKGAGAVIGFDDYVLSTYAQNTTNAILTEMMDNDTTFGEAVTLAKTTYGASDGGSDNAYLLTAGADDLQLPNGSFSNLDFEEGVLGVWAKDGDGRIITQLGETMPTGGQYTGIVSTGLGYTTTSGSIEQSACLASTASTMSFNWNLFSEEFLEYCNSSYDDSFSVAMCETGTDNCSSFNTSINTLCSAGTEQLSASDVSFDKGGVYDTGWQSESVDISGLAGKSVTLTVSSSDVGDSIYDTAILVDDIVIE